MLRSIAALALAAVSVLAAGRRQDLGRATIQASGQRFTLSPGATLITPDGQRISVPSYEPMPDPVIVLEFQPDGGVLVVDEKGVVLTPIGAGERLTLTNGSGAADDARQEPMTASSLRAGERILVTPPDEARPPRMYPMATFKVTCASGHSGNCTGRYRCKFNGTWSAWGDVSVVPGSSITLDCGEGNDIEFEIT